MQNFFFLNLSDYFFQKLKLNFFPLSKSGNSMLNYWIKHSSESLRKISFGENIIFAKIIGLSYIQNGEEGWGLNGQKWPKMLVSTRIRTRGLPGKQKMNEIQTKALPLSHRGWYKKTTVIKNKIIIYLNLA